ncbi:MAG: diacylglycerol kinase family lipid kinase [Chitinophagales bacterium]|nr:diacylglycerol kinase family lipid kinase [Chitinophagaceae bacterium]MCB9063987.1 diacylglycerol kinase family lipid kinase [Chitinophagales bacterium]
MEHLVFIINPKSGVEREKAILKAIDEKLDQTQFTYEIIHTEYAKHGTELARKAAQKGAYAVVAVGGDGSVNDIVAGLIGTDTALAIIPKGSGNGMARSMEIPLKEYEAIDVINRGNTIMMDIGYANDRPFISNAGVAFDALISKKFAKSTRRGFAIYSWLVTRYMWTYKEWEWQLKIDGEEIKEKAFIISVANGRQFGYNFQIAPGASWTDGLLDVVVIKKFPKILGGALVMRAMNGTITDSPFVDHFTAKEVVIHHPKLKLMQTDGDAHACENTIRFRLDEAKQKVIVP